MMAEKLYAIYDWGQRPGRIKDYFDIVTFARIVPPEDTDLHFALESVCQARMADTKNLLEHLRRGEAAGADREEEWRTFVASRFLHSATPSFEYIREEVHSYVSRIPDF